MKEHYINKSNNFIAGWYIDDQLCDELIDYHTASNNKFLGSTYQGVDNSVKESTDVLLEAGPLANKYIKYLYKVTDLYVEKYSYCNAYGPWNIGEPIQIQHYKINQAFYGWHCERVNTHPILVARHLVFMTYLNTITDGGETEWFYQNIKIKPEKGLTLLWPPEWTFTHRGIPSPTQDKYVITGWYNMLEKYDRTLPQHKFW